MTPDRPPLVAAAIAHGVTDPRVLAAFEEVPRSRFVAPEHARQADAHFVRLYGAHGFRPGAGSGA
jgi:protein-L-isoaspartate O-methyltransferase